MHLCRAVVAVIAVTMAMTLAAPAAAAPYDTVRDRPATTRPNPDVVIRGSGWGHGVGMSQYGAYAQAQAGWGYPRILKHWYRGVSVGQASMPSRIRVGLASSLTFSNVEAVDGRIPWRECDASGCTTKATQPAGTTWKVQLLSGGNWRLTHNGEVKYRGGKGKRLIGAFNPQGRPGGTLIKAFNPNGSRRFYKWGRLEYRANSPANGTMYMVLDIPSMDLYLRGLAEMPSSWGSRGGLAALKAQAVTGRTYALGLHRGNGGISPGCWCSLLATPANQAYGGYDNEMHSTSHHWVRAVEDTSGRVVTHNGNLIGAFYSSSHGTRSENIEDSWAYGSTPMPYLKSVSDSWSKRAGAGNPYATWDVTVTNAALASFTGSGMHRVRRIQMGSRTDGRTPRTIVVTGVDRGGKGLRVNRAGGTTSNNKGIVGIDLRSTFSLRSQQVRRLGFAPFVDDDGRADEYAIVFATRARLMSGRSATQFQPGQAATRAEAALALFRLLQIPRAPKGRDYFNDDNGRREEAAINALAHAGIVKGKKFNPDRPFQKRHAAVWWQRTLALKPGGVDRFTDDDGKPFERAANAVARAKLLSGCAPKRFCPYRSVTRGQLAALTWRTTRQYR
ncbi:MAG TPA: SpoIID/LytB domain-containing protein [Egibacteraceae bacterium]|nr:SpoIID/LytB domain-containing protein [Egibacteraceae bacterium]